MPIRWTLGTDRIGPGAKRAMRRFGIKAGIVAAGAVVALGTVNRGTYVAHTTLAERVVASAPVNVKTPWGTTKTADSAIAPGGLDAGVDHDRISYWIKRLSNADFGKQLA